MLLRYSKPWLTMCYVICSTNTFLSSSTPVPRRTIPPRPVGPLMASRELPLCKSREMWVPCAFSSFPGASLAREASRWTRPTSRPLLPGLLQMLHPGVQHSGSPSHGTHLLQGALFLHSSCWYCFPNPQEAFHLCLHPLHARPWKIIFGGGRRLRCGVGPMAVAGSPTSTGGVAPLAGGDQAAISGLDSGDPCSSIDSTSLSPTAPKPTTWSRVPFSAGSRRVRMSFFFFLFIQSIFSLLREQHMCTCHSHPFS